MRASHGLGRRLRRILRYYYLRLVRIDDSPEKIAGGVALGVVLGVFPTFGLGLILAVALAHRVHVNRAAALLGSLIMNPVTTPIVWGVSAWVGAALIGVNEAEITALKDGIELSVKGWLGDLLGVQLAAGLETGAAIRNPWRALFGRLGLAYALGNTAVAAVAAVAAYYVTARVAAVVHARRLARRHRRAMRRVAAQPDARRPARPRAPAEGADARPGV